MRVIILDESELKTGHKVWCPRGDAQGLPFVCDAAFDELRCTGCLLKEAEHICRLCGEAFEPGITIWPYEGSFAHPECVQGVPIDHGD